MSDQKTTDKKLDKSLKELSGKQRAKAAAEQKEARKWKTYGIAAIVIAVLIAALLFWDSGFIQRRATAVTVGDNKYSAAEVDYYYYSLYDNMYAYAGYYGLDTSKSLKEQEITEGTTWYQYLCDNAKASLTNVATLAQEAKAAGYEMTDETRAKIEDEIQQTKDSASKSGGSYGYYLKRLFGRLMTPAIYKKVITEYEYAYAYETAKTAEFEVSDADVQGYYDEHRDTIDTYDFVCYKVDAMPASTDEDGNDITLTEEDYTAAAKDAKELADELLAEMKAGAMEDSELVSDERVTDFSDVSANSFSSYVFGEWLTAKERKTGDAAVLDQTTKVTMPDAAEGDEGKEVTQSYFVTLFNDRKLDEYYAGTMHTVLVEAEGSDGTADYGAAVAKAEELKQQFEANGATEEAFLALTEETEDAAEDEEDAGSITVTPHSYESTAKGILSDALEGWMFDGRKPGDVEIMQDTEAEGYQLVYFVGYDDEFSWVKNARSTIQSTRYQEWLEGISENYEAKETSFFSQVG